ncbi:hypothetical protein K439DRAFT_1350084, partial [Ramaria rubella]
LLIGLIDVCPDMYLDKLQKKMLEVYGIIVGRTTVQNALVKEGMTCKKANHHSIVICIHLTTFLAVKVCC